MTADFQGEATDLEGDEDSLGEDTERHDRAGVENRRNTKENQEECQLIELARKVTKNQTLHSLATQTD